MWLGDIDSGVIMGVEKLEEQLRCGSSGEFKPEDRINFSAGRRCRYFT
jgi:hypothetical protein